MDIIIGLLIITLGSFGQSSSYVPINKVKQWSWESFWLIQGLFAWVIFPLLGVFLSVPFHLLTEIYFNSLVLYPLLYGILWGIGGLTFGLSMRYLGVSLGQSISLGTCAAFGTIIPAIWSKENLLQGQGLILLICVSITLMGIAIIGYAGILRASDMSKSDQQQSIKEFALTKGILLALLAGLMSACFSLGLESGREIQVLTELSGCTELLSLNPVIFLVATGGFLTNAIYCIFQNIRNHSGSEYFSIPMKVLGRNIMYCALAGLLWYSQFFALGMGKSFFAESPVLLAFSWGILMSMNVIFSNIWGLLLKEWNGVTRKTVYVLLLGVLILIFSIILPNILK